MNVTVSQTFLVVGGHNLKPTEIRASPRDWLCDGYTRLGTRASNSYFLEGLPVNVRARVTLLSLS